MPDLELELLPQHETHRWQQLQLLHGADNRSWSCCCHHLPQVSARTAATTGASVCHELDLAHKELCGPDLAQGRK